jgi:hypothetical protein
MDGVVVHQSRAFESVDHTTVASIPVTTVARTLIDLGAVRPEYAVENATDSAERDRLVHRHEITLRFQALAARGRNGIATMRSVLDDREAVVPGSVLERRFLRLLAHANLPRPSVQHRVVLANGRVAYLDAAYVAVYLGFEIDGHRWHATRAQRAADNRRIDRLADLGWEIHRFTYEQVVDDGRGVIDTVRRALHRKRFGATG